MIYRPRHKKISKGYSKRRGSNLRIRSSRLFPLFFIIWPRGRYDLLITSSKAEELLMIIVTY